MVAHHRLILRDPPVTTESLLFGPCPGTSPGSPPVPGEVWASHPLPNSHTASAGPSERKAAPAPPRTTARPQSLPARPAAVPSSPAAGSGRGQVLEKPQQSLLHSSRHRPPSCRSLRRREPGGEGRKPGVGNPGIVADPKSASMKVESQGTETDICKVERPRTGATYSFERAGRGGLRHPFWKNWTEMCPRSEVVLLPYK